MSLSKPFNLTNEIITILASGDDEDALGNVEKALIRSSKQQSQQQEEVRKAIQRLTRAGKEASTRALYEDKENLAKLETLKVETEATDRHIEKIENEIKTVEETILEKEQDAKFLQKKRTELDNEKNEVLPATKYNFSLFTNISHIRWDYECDDDQVKGFVASLKDVKPFCLNAKQNSKFFIANHLWDLIDA